MPKLQDIANEFFQAFYEREWKGSPESDPGKLTIEEAYNVQQLVAEQRVAGGEKVVGYKIGCTSSAIQAQFGLNEPICGRLFHPHVQMEGSILDWSKYANCAIEPEMVLKIGRDLSGADLSDQELIDSIEFVSPGVELHHFTFWQEKPTLQELICSGGIHAGLIIGKSQVSPNNLNFSKEVFSVYKDDQLHTSASASEIMGGPLRSLRWLVNSLAKLGDCLPKGSWVIPGSPTELVEIHQDTKLKVVIGDVGEVVAQFHQ